MHDLIQLTAAELAARLRSGDVSSEDVTRAHLDRIAEVDGELNAFIAVNDGAIAAARDIDERRSRGDALHDLAGVPVAIKDVLVTTDMPSTSGSRILEGYLSPFDATVVAKARTAGLVPLGKTNMDEFAMGSTTESSAYGATKNPWNTSKIPGGSGGGSAAALAAFETPLALGSDTGGSIRQPAFMTGTVGAKPTYGGVSRYGSIAMGSSLDQIGPCARTVLDAALLHDVIAGHDWHDTTSLQHEWPSMAAAAREGAQAETLNGVRIGIVTELLTDAVHADVRRAYLDALALAEGQGAELIELSAKHFADAVAAYYLIMPAEASSNLARYDSVRFGLRVTPDGGGTVEEVMGATRAAGFGAEVKRRIILGTYALSAGYYDAYYGSAQKVRTLVQRDFAAAFEQVDVLATPTAQTTAWDLGTSAKDPLATYLSDAMTIPANLAGVPAMSLPIGVATEDGLPIGLQLMAPHYADARMYRIGAAFESLITARDGKPFWHTLPMIPGKAGA